MGLKSRNKCLYVSEAAEADTQTQRGEGQVVTAAEAGVMSPQAKGRLEPPEAERGNSVSPRTLRADVAPLTS